MLESVYTILSYEEIDMHSADLARYFAQDKKYAQETRFLAQVQEVNGALRSGMVLSWQAAHYVRGYQTLKQVHIWCDFWDEEKTRLAHRCYWYEIDPPYTYGTDAPPQSCIPLESKNAEWPSLYMQMCAGGHRHVKDWITCYYCGRDWDAIEQEGHAHVFLPGHTQCYYCQEKK